VEEHYSTRLTASRAWYCGYQTIALLTESSLGRKVINITSPDSNRGWLVVSSQNPDLPLRAPPPTYTLSSSHLVSASHCSFGVVVISRSQLVLVFFQHRQVLELHVPTFLSERKCELNTKSLGTRSFMGLWRSRVCLSKRICRIFKRFT
jgi:hypothetical protein